MFTWKSHAGLKFHFSQNDRYEIHTVLSFISPQFMWTQVKSWLNTKVRFSTEMKSHTGLSSFSLSCEWTLNLMCLWKIPNILRLWTATSLILASLTKNYCLNNYILHQQLAKRQINFWGNEKWPCIKNFIIIFVLFIFGPCLLCFLKILKKYPDFWKKRVSSLRYFCHWSLSSVCCRLNVYQSDLILRNLPRGSCPEKFLVTHLMWTNRVLTQLTFTCSK